MQTVRWSCAAVVSALACLAGCSKSTVTKTVVGGGGAQSGNFAVSSGNFVIQEGQPAVGFNLVQRPDDNRQFGYFMIVKYPPGQGNNFSTGGTNDGSKGHSTAAMTIGGKVLSVEYDATVRSGEPLLESLSIGGKEYSLEKGQRVFLVDLAADPMNVVQLEFQLNLPSDAPEVKSTADAEAIASKTLAALKNASPQVAEFISQ